MFLKIVFSLLVSAQVVFGQSGFNNSVYDIHSLDSNVYAGGLFTNATGIGGGRITVWNGDSWDTMGAGVDAQVSAITSIGTDVYAGGTFSIAGGNPATYIARWNGTDWQSFGDSLNGVVEALATNGTDLYAGGLFTKAGDSVISYIARWDGTTWRSVGGGLNGQVFDIFCDGNNVYVAGDFTTAGGKTVNRIAMWDGLQWNKFGTGANGSVRRVKVRDGIIYAAGNFSMIGGVTVNRLAKWTGSSWQGFAGGADAIVHTIEFHQDTLYAGGEFSQIGGKSIRKLAKWTGAEWTAVGAGISQKYTGSAAVVYDLESHQNLLFVGGNFATAGTTSSPCLAVWNGVDWRAAAFINKVMHPTNLVALNGDEAVVLKWNRPADNSIVKYRVFGGTASEPTTLVDSTMAGNDTTINVTDLTNGVLYYLRVKSVDSTGKASDYSPEVSTIPGEYTSIQNAIDAAKNGDTLVLMTDFTENIVINKPMTLMGGTGGDTVKISGATVTLPTVTITADDVSLYNLKIMGRDAVGSETIAGQGIRAVNVNNLVVRDLLVIGGSWTDGSQYGSPAMTVEGGMNVTVRNSVFHGGTSYGSFTSAEALAFHNSADVTIAHSVISGGKGMIGGDDNTPLGTGGRGLAIRVCENVSVDSSSISGGRGVTFGAQSANGGPGGVAVRIDSSSDVSLTSIEATGGRGGYNNNGPILGSGGHAMNASNSDQIIISGSTFKGGMNGAGVDMQHSEITRGGDGLHAGNLTNLHASNSVFEGGDASWSLYGLANEGGIGAYFEMTSASTFSDCEFKGGDGGDTDFLGPGGPGIVFDSSSGNTVTNSTISGGNGGQIPSGFEIYGPGGHGITAIRHSVDYVFTSAISGGPGSPNGEIVYADSTSSIIVDPPAVPTGLTAHAGPGVMHLTWNHTPGADLLRYDVYLDTQAVASVLVDSADFPDTTLSIHGLINNTVYYARIRAVNLSGTMSGFSTEVSVTPMALTNVEFTPPDSGDGSHPVTLIFDEVLSEGSVSLVVEDSGHSLPPDFRSPSPPKFYDLSTTIGYDDSINVIITYAEDSFVREDSIRLLQFSSGVWLGVGAAIDTLNNTVSGRIGFVSLLTLAESANIGPAISSPLPDTTLDENFGPSTFARLSTIFNDPDGDTLIYDAFTLAGGVDVELFGDTLIVSGYPRFHGTTSVVVIASDEQFSIADTFYVNVINTVPAPVWVSGYGANHQAALRWTSSGDDIAIYRLLTTEDLNPPTQIDSTVDTTRTIYNLQNDVAYGFVVVAVDTLGTLSPPSAIIEIQPVNAQPQLVKALRDTVAKEDFGNFFVAFLPDNFTDPDSTPLEFSLHVLQPGVTAWISEDSLYVSGWPDFNGQTDMVITASDDDKHVKDTLSLTINPVNDPPIVTAELPDTSIAEDAGSVFIALLSDNFSDVEDDSLSFLAVSTDSLEVWISGDSLYVQPGNNVIGTFEVDVQATDDSGSTIQASFMVHCFNVNDAPVLTVPFNNVQLSEDQGTTMVALLGGHFSDADNDPLNPIVTIGDTLLARVVVRNDSLYVTPCADAYGQSSVEITVTDASQASAQTGFMLVIQPVNDPPVLSGSIPDTSVLEDTPTIALYLLSDFFHDVDNGELIYALHPERPDSIHIAIINDSLFVRPLENVNGTFGFTVTASDDSGASALTSITILVLNVNDPPELIESLPDVTASEDTGRFFLAEINGRFADTDGDDLSVTFYVTDTTLVSIQRDGDSLFAVTRSDRNGASTVVVSATDPYMTSVFDTLLVTITPVNDSPYKVESLRDSTVTQNPPDIRYYSLYGAFTDVDNTSLTFAAFSSNPGIGTVISQDTLTITFADEFYGVSDVIVQASDGEFTIADTLTLAVHDVTPPAVALFAIAPPSLRIVRFGVAVNEEATSVFLSVNGDSIPATMFATGFFGDYLAERNDTMLVTAWATDVSGNTGSITRSFRYHGLDKSVYHKKLQLTRIDNNGDANLLLGDIECPKIPERWTMLQPSVELRPSRENVTVQLRWNVEDGSFDRSTLGLYEWSEHEQDWRFLNSRQEGDALVASKSGSGIVAVFHNPDQQSVPETFALKQNYPNPFNPSTTIAYDLAEPAAVSVVVYNILGARVARLVDARQQAGTYSVQWNGKNDRGESVASGIYFYRIKAGSYVKTRKMLLLK